MESGACNPVLHRPARTVVQPAAGEKTPPSLWCSGAGPPATVKRRANAQSSRPYARACRCKKGSSAAPARNRPLSSAASRPITKKGRWPPQPQRRTSFRTHGRAGAPAHAEMDFLSTPDAGPSDRVPSIGRDTARLASRQVWPNPFPLPNRIRLDLMHSSQRVGCLSARFGFRGHAVGERDEVSAKRLRDA